LLNIIEASSNRGANNKELLAFDKQKEGVIRNN